MLTDAASITESDRERGEESKRGVEVSPKIARYFDGPHNESEVGNQQR